MLGRSRCPGGALPLTGGIVPCKYDPTRALVAEDDPVSRGLLERALRSWGYRVESAADGLEAKNMLENRCPPRLVILDWNMPGVTGVELCRRIRRMKEDDPYTYIILLTGRGSARDVNEGMTAGADDYIVKPFDWPELQARIRAARRILDLQGRFLLTGQTLREQALRDGLTGLTNRAGIEEFLERELCRCSRDGKPLSVLFCDLDHFKAVNDTHGHLTGDTVLRAVAGVLEGAMRPYDAVGRWGGEEFLVVMPGCRADDAVAKAEDLRRRVTELRLPIEVGTISTTLSFGVAERDDLGAGEAGRLVEKADAALYEAKRAGRNRVARAGRD